MGRYAAFALPVDVQVKSIDVRNVVTVSGTTGPRLGVSVAVAVNDAAQELLEPGHLLHREGQETDLLGRQQLEALTTSQNMTLKTWHCLPCVTPELPAICERPEAKPNVKQAGVGHTWHASS